MPSAKTRLRPSDLGWLGTGVGIVIAIGLTALRQANTGDLEPGPTIATSVAWLVFWSGPAVVAAIGTAGGRREVVVAAGLSYVWMAGLSFSGVTLVLLSPAILFLYAGLRSPARGHAPGRPDQRLLVGAILALLVGSFIGLFGTFETVCWARSADGTVQTMRAVDETQAGEVSLGTFVASGCSGGQASVLGAAIVVGCVAGAAAPAAMSARRRSEPS